MGALVSVDDARKSLQEFEALEENDQECPCARIDWAMRWLSWIDWDLIYRG